MLSFLKTALAGAFLASYTSASSGTYDTTEGDLGDFPDF